MPSKSSRRSPSEDRRKRSLRVICESPANLKCAKGAVSLLKEHTGSFRITVQKDAFSGIGTDDEVASALVSLRLTDAGRREERAIDSFALRDFEKRVLSGTSRARGVPYEGVGLMKLYQRILPGHPSNPDEICVVITDRLAMTWSEDDLRYHARVAVFGFPSVVSMSGLVEAPARPREYYLAKQVLDPSGAGAADEVLAAQFAGRFLEAEDERTEKVLCGYLLQCIFYACTLRPFCGNMDCVLFNAHWQEEMIRAQVTSGKLCERHRRSLERIISGEPASWG